MAEIAPSGDTKRTRLTDVIPLDSPFTVFIEPTRTCNFKCFYCMHSTRGEHDGTLAQTGLRLGHMDMKLYQKAVEEIMKFPTPVKRIVFSGLGEPLMNPKLPEMVKMLRAAGHKGRIDIITNGSLLNHELSDALIAAGMNRLQVSVQGLTRQQYIENCGVAFEPKMLQAELAYFYERSRGTAASLYVKIIDDMVKMPEEKEQFYQTYDTICDTMWIEHLIVMESQMGDHGGRVDRSKDLLSDPITKQRTSCSPIFYMINIGCDGDVFPCPVPGLPKTTAFGTIKRQTLQELWNGSVRTEQLGRNLKEGFRAISHSCRACEMLCCIQDKAEDIEDHREELLERILSRYPVGEEK